MDRRTFGQLVGASLSASRYRNLFAASGDPASDTSPEAVQARVEFDPEKRTWKIGNGLFEREMSLDPRRGLVAKRLVDPKSGKNWLTDQAEMGSDVYLMIGDTFCSGPSPAAGFEYVDQASERQPDGSTVLKIRFALPQKKLELTLIYRCFDDTPFLEQWCRIENKSDKPSAAVARFDPFFLNLEAGPGEQPFNLHYLNGVRDFGYQRGVQEDIQPYAPYRLRKEPLRPQSCIQLDSSAPGDRYGRKELSCTQYFSWFSIEHAELPGGLMGGLLWDGAWVLNFDRWSPHQVRVYGGVNKCSHILEPGGVLESPRAFYGPYEGDLDDGLRSLHHYLRRHIMAPNPDDQFPWVQYNPWIAYVTKVSEATLKPEIDIAQEIGVEVFYLDAGWCENMENSMENGLGNWVVDRKKFPSGLTGFSEDVHRRGMKFALWVEPERTNLKFVGNEIKENWLSKRWGYYVGLDGTAVLCFGDPEVRAWAKQWLERLIADSKVDWLRWDLNSYNICNRPDHGHQAGDGDFMHVNGLYEVMGYLRQRFPQLVIENCSAGGNRFGFQMMRYAVTTLNSDVLWPSYRSRYQMIGCSYPFPAQYQLGTYRSAPRASGGGETRLTSGGTKEPVDGNSSAAYMDYLFRSRMLGAFGISDRMVEWTPNIKEAARKAIRDFKKARVIMKGEVYHPLPQPMILTPPLHPPAEWEALQYYEPNLDAAVLFCFRAQAPENQKTLPVRGVHDDHHYRVRHEDSKEEHQSTGQSLKQSGITIRLPEMNSSEIIWIERV